jgi:hypothetical protein
MKKMPLEPQDLPDVELDRSMIVNPVRYQGTGYSSMNLSFMNIKRFLVEYLGRRITKKGPDSKHFNCV